MASHRGHSRKRARLDAAAGAAAGEDGGRDATLPLQCTTLIVEAGRRLSASPLVVCTAMVFMHRFRKYQLEGIDEALVAMTALYLAAKAEESPVELRDLINVGYRSLHPKEAPLSVGSTFNALREAIVNCELILLRALAFDTFVDHPHKTLLHFLRGLEKDVVAGTRRDGRRVMQELTQSAWNFLMDLHHSPMCVERPAAELVCAAIHVAALCLGVLLPAGEQTLGRGWWQALCPRLEAAALEALGLRVLAVYDAIERQTPSAPAAANGAGKRPGRKGSQPSTTPARPPPSGP